MAFHAPACLPSPGCFITTVRHWRGSAPYHFRFSDSPNPAMRQFALSSRIPRTQVFTQLRKPFRGHIAISRPICHHLQVLLSSLATKLGRPVMCIHPLEKGARRRLRTTTKSISRTYDSNGRRCTRSLSRASRQMANG